MLVGASIGWVVAEDDGVGMWSALGDAVTRRMKSVDGERRRTDIADVAWDDRSTVAGHCEDTFESLCDQGRAQIS